MTYTVAIIGAGIGREHLLGYAALPEQFRVKTMCDLDTTRAENVCEGHDVTVTDDLAGVLSDPEIDIVNICLPPHLHFKVAVQALEAGKHVVCEKPLVGSLEEADQLITKAEDTGKQVFPVFQYRYGLGTAQLQALIDAGLAGRCYAGSLETHWNRPAEYYDIDWRGTWAGEQGGALLGHAIHIHDLLSSILGPVARVYADAATRVNDIEVEDCAALSIRMADGAVITSSVTLGAADDMSRMRLMFEGFTVESDHAPYAPARYGWTFKARAPFKQGDLDAVLAGVGNARSGFPGLFTVMADALDGKGGREVTLADGRGSLDFVTAAYASARSGAPVDLPLGPDHPLYGGWMP